MGQHKHHQSLPDLSQPTHVLEAQLESFLRSAQVRMAVAAVMLIGELQQRKQQAENEAVLISKTEHLDLQDGAIAHEKRGQD